MMMMRSTTVADRIQSGAPARPNLNALLEAARDHKMTWQDRLRQKRSWLVGNRPASDTRSAEEVIAKLREDAPELFADEVIAAQAARIAELEDALELALAKLANYEPGDSRAVSDVFVALAHVQAFGIGNESSMAIINAARRGLRALTKGDDR